MKKRQNKQNHCVRNFLKNSRLENSHSVNVKIEVSYVTFVGLLIFYQDEINHISHGGFHPIAWIKNKFSRSAE